MGFNLSAFGAGFAEAASEDIQRNRKLAELRGTEAVKSMQLNYKKVIEDNKAKESELVENLNLLKTYDSSATDSELYAIATKAPVMSQITSLIKDKSFDPASFKLSNFVKVTENNVTGTALERIKLLSVLPTMAKDAVTEQMKPSDNIFSDMVSRSASKAKEKAMLEQAQVMGIPLERLRAAQNYIRPSAEVNATVDMTKLRPAKTFAEQEDAAKLAILNAVKNKDPVAENLAKADQIIFKTIKDNMSSEQTKFSEKLVTLKNAALNGTPQEKKAAEAELAKIWALEQKEAIAKKIPGEDGEGKVPALSALNTFTSAAVGRAIAAKYGDLVKSKQIAMVEKPDGGVSISYIGTDATVRNSIMATQANAARSALSLYTNRNGQPINRDVASVLNSFAAPTQIEEAAPTTPAPAAPALPTARGLGSAPAGRNPAPAATAAAPAVDVQTERTKAKEAITRGADAVAVAKRFKETTGQDL